MGGKRQAALVPARGLGTCPMGSLILKGGRPRAGAGETGHKLAWARCGAGPGSQAHLVERRKLGASILWEILQRNHCFHQKDVWVLGWVTEQGASKLW